MTEEKKPWVKQKERMEKWYKDEVEEVKPVDVPKPYFLNKPRKGKDTYVNEEAKDE